MDVAATTDSGEGLPAGLGSRGPTVPPRCRRDQGLDRGEGSRVGHQRPRQGSPLCADIATLVVLYKYNKNRV